MCPLDRILDVVAIVGMPLHCFLMTMVGWLMMRPPILYLTNHRIVSKHIYIDILPFCFLSYNTSYSYIEDGSTLLKSRGGGRSMNILIEENMPLYLFNCNKKTES